MTLEHVIPLRGELVSGLHVHNNLAIMWEADNRAKGNKFEIEEEMTTSKEVTPRQKEIKLQKALIEGHSIITCTNCEQWTIHKTCAKWNVTPPPEVLVVGCEDHVKDIPF